MNPVRQETMRRVPFKPSRRHVLVAIALATTCGGQRGLHTTWDGAQGGDELSSGGAGVAAKGGTGGVGGSAGAISTTGGAMAGTATGGVNVVTTEGAAGVGGSTVVIGSTGGVTAATGGASVAATEGTGGVGGSTGAIGSTGGVTAATGGAISHGGSTGTAEDGGAPDGFCDTGLLWGEVTARVTGGVAGQLVSCGPSPGKPEALVFDAEGHLVDDTASYSDPTAKGAWLASLAGDRWPCLAGQTIDYGCLVE
jgi:hypothetical protein